MKEKNTATVVKSAGSHFMISKLPEWKPFEAVLKGKVRLKGSKSTNPVAVGDRVVYEEGNPAAIAGICDRRNCLVRRSANLSKQSHVLAANIDMAYVIVSLYFPELQLPFLDRILVSAEVYDVPITIVLNKIDLYREQSEEYFRYFHDVYEDAGYRVLDTSVKTGEGIDKLCEDCKGRVCLFLGESGVGKSSVIKAMDPSLNPKIGRMSAAHFQGTHTTSLYEMYPVRTGGFVIDTPGIRGFGLVDMEREEIALYFPEMLRLSGRCKFAPCTHTHEPDCAVKRAVDEGIISADRYNSYLGMLEEDLKFR